jgi:soluble lytic murein transglycosylase
VLGFIRFFLFALLLTVVVCPGMPANGQTAAPQTASDSSSPKPKPTAKKKAAPTAKKKTTRAKSRRNTPRFHRMHQAFVASATLKPMAMQLLQNRTPAAYAGVEGFARKHSGEDAGSLAWLAVGYAHFLDHDCAKAIDPLNRAKPHAGDIGDYAAFYLANCYIQTGRNAEALAALSAFEKAYPASLLVRDARVLHANALLTDNRPTEADALLENDRVPLRADLEYALGRAYEAAGDMPKAAAVFQHLYFTVPLSPEAGGAETELRKMGSVPGVTPPSFGDRRNRADTLAKAKRYSEAVDAYRDLLNQATPTDKPSIQLSLADALLRSGERKDARRLLDSLPLTSPEVVAQRLFTIGEIQRASDDDDAFLHTLDDLRQAAPTSPWLEQALFAAGNIYLLRRDYDKAIDSFRELEQRFPGSARAHYAHWKVAWLSLRQGRTADAKTGFEQQVALYPDSNEVSDALYWRARLAEEDGDKPMAAAFYGKINERYRNYYYGPLARERMAKLNVGDDPPHYAILDHVPAITNVPALANTSVPDDNLRVEKARLLENGGLLDFAVRELKAAAEEEHGNWLPGEIARMYQDAGLYNLAVETLKHAIPSYFAIDISSLPRNYWEALFPRPYWPDMKKFATANALDPYMVASLIRQESEFNPNAVSPKNALGLMQLLPKVGKGVAKQEKLKHFATPQLFTPAVNLQLGTKYFRSMVDQFGGFEYALAAYNAGDYRVRDWQANGKYRDVQEFVESIPFTETREYVQAIMRNANVYRQLYGTP